MSRILVLGVWALTAFCTSATAQSQDSPSAPTAPVILDGATLFRVRGTTAYPAEQRAADIAARIAAVAADAAQSPESLHVVEGEHGTEIRAGNIRLLIVVDEDNRIEGISRPLLAHIYATRISQAVAAYRKDRTYSQLARNASLTALSTILLGLAAFLLVKFFGLINRFVARRYQDRIERIEAQSFKFIRARSILAAARAIIIMLTAVIAAGCVYAYLHFVLNLYPWTRRIADGLLQFLLAPLGTAATGILLAIPSLIVVAVIILAARYLLKMTRLFFSAIREKQINLAGFEAEWADPTMRIVRVLIIVCAAIVAYPYIPGSDSAAFKGVTIFADCCSRSARHR